MAEQLDVDYQKMLSEIDSRIFLEVEKLRLLFVALRDSVNLIDKSVV